MRLSARENLIEFFCCQSFKTYKLQLFDDGMMHCYMLLTVIARDDIQLCYWMEPGYHIYLNARRLQSKMTPK